MDRLRHRDDLALRVRPLLEVLHGALGDERRHAARDRDGAREPTVLGVARLVERRHVDALDVGEPAEQRRAVDAVTLRRAQDVVDLEHDLLAVAHDRRIDERCERLGVERGMATDEHDRVGSVALGAAVRDAAEVEQVQQVGVPELVRQRDGEDVERPQRQVLLERERRDAALAHPLLEVDPRRVAALGERRRTGVEDLVEDLDALVRLADLVGVGVAEEPAHVRAGPVVHHHVVLAADVLRGLAHVGQQRLEDLEDRRRGRCSEPTAVHRARRPLRQERVHTHGAEGSEHVGPPIGCRRGAPGPAGGMLRRDAEDASRRGDLRGASDPRPPCALRRPSVGGAPRERPVGPIEPTSGPLAPPGPCDPMLDVAGGRRAVSGGPGALSGAAGSRSAAGPSSSSTRSATSRRS